MAHGPLQSLSRLSGGAYAGRRESHGLLHAVCDSSPASPKLKETLLKRSDGLPEDLTFARPPGQCGA